MTEATHDRLLETAAEQFADLGYAGVSMRSIARSAGVTQAAIYHHFANKDELYAAAVEYLYEGESASLLSEVRREAEPEARLVLLVSRLMQVFDERSQMRQIYFRELLEGDESRMELLSKRAFPEIEEFIHELMAELAPHMDSHLMVLSLTGLIFNHLEARKLSAQKRPGEEKYQECAQLAQHITTLILKGVHTQ